MRAIWDLTKNFWQVYTWVNDDRDGNAYFIKDQGDTDWDRIQQLLDMSDDEMAARFDEWHNQEGDSEEDDDTGDTGDTGDEDGEENETVSEEEGGDEDEVEVDSRCSLATETPPLVEKVRVTVAPASSRSSKTLMSFSNSAFIFAPDIWS